MLQMLVHLKTNNMKEDAIYIVIEGKGYWLYYEKETLTAADDCESPRLYLY
jgi:hypothetical protein